MTDAVRVAAVAAALPERVRTSDEVEELIRAASPGFSLRRGTIASMTGIRARRVAPEDAQCSDLAAEAGRRALALARIDPLAVDLLLFAAAAHDMLEPATSNMVQEKVGTRCQVLDVKNACNSFLNGMQVAEALIRSGACETALVTTGEVCSRAIAWRVRCAAEFKQQLPGYTMGDAGAAAVLVRSGDGRGIFYRRFLTLSEHWELATIPGGGSAHPRGDEFTYLRGDGARLKDVFVRCGTPVFQRMMADAGRCYGDFQRILAHQVSVPYVRRMIKAAGMPAHKVESTVVELGNMASASIPVAFAQAIERGALAPGDRVLCVGMASGISVGVVMLDV